MDNLTHSIIGLAAGELIDRALPAEPTPERARARHRLLLVTGALASNFPDIDLVFMPFLSRPLGYLLEHRGHTHTVLFAIPQMLLLVALLWLLWPAARNLLRVSAAARKGVAIAAGLGLLLHLGMDYLNSYGLHPFAPVDARWLYGDVLYIIEPVFWVLLGVPLILQIQRPAVRIGLLALLAAILIGCTAAGFLLWPSLALLAVAALAVARGRRALLTGSVLALAWIGLQASMSQAARNTVAAHLAQQDGASTLLDAAMTPFPANPVCWSFVSVESDAAHGTYRLRRGVLSLDESVLPTSSCPPKLAGGAAPAGVPGVALFSSVQASLADLKHLRQTNCHVDAWLRFARMPLVDPDSATDLRFGNLGATNFSSIDYAARAGTPCPAWLPRWDPPRADLLGRVTLESSPARSLAP
ncbi:metal-dependent hydrolase [Massilia sp. S19_KUP03_FR1]|uniref:metal-dependent hydrolase n=1 Tax=Massilia sp. S19_KUP03_FR1 TaxID=3025503 RepID=UPI002FCDA1D6